MKRKWREKTGEKNSSPKSLNDMTEKMRMENYK